MSLTVGDHLGQTMISLPRIFTLELNGTPFPVQCSHANKNDIVTLCAQIERYLLEVLHHQHSDSLDVLPSSKMAQIAELLGNEFKCLQLTSTKVGVARCDALGVTF